MTRVVLYARVSTDLQEKEHTIQSQLEALRKYAQDKGYEVAALAVADLSFSNGSLFGSVDISNVGAGLFATLLMALGTLQILRRRPIKPFSLTEPSPPLFVGLYALGLFIVFRLT